MDLFLPCGRLQRNFDELPCAYYLRRKSRRLSVPHCCLRRDVDLLYGLPKILAAFCYLSEYPTCTKAMRWRGIRHALNFAWPIEPFFQYGPMPSSGLWFFGNWIG